MGRNNGDFKTGKYPDAQGRVMSDEVYKKRLEGRPSQNIDPSQFCDTPGCQNPATKFSWENGLGCEDHDV